MRRFEFSAGGSDKFWEVELSGNELHVHFGRIGTQGQRQTKSFAQPELAQKECEKLIAEKVKKGYVEVQAAGTADTTHGAAPQGSGKRSVEALKKLLLDNAIDIATFERVSLAEEDEEEEQRHADDSFYMLSVPKANAMDIWRTIRAAVDQTGYWPIFTGDYDMLFESFGFEDFDEANILKFAGGVQSEEWFNKRVEEESEMLAEVDEEDGDGWHPQSREQNSAARDKFYVLESYGDDTASLIFCPTKTPWQVAAVLRWGGSNDGIQPWEHVALHKYWHTKYGAEPVCVTFDIWEFVLSKVPNTKEEAVALAREQFIYCPDLVHQGCGSIEGLASELIYSPRWYFWWD